MFSDSNIAKGFTMSGQKALYIVSDGLEPLLGKRSLMILHHLRGHSQLILDETTTVQDKNKWMC